MRHLAFLAVIALLGHLAAAAKHSGITNADAGQSGSEVLTGSSICQRLCAHLCCLYQTTGKQFASKVLQSKLPWMVEFFAPVSRKPDCFMPPDR
jgi:hypothetical protein